MIDHLVNRYRDCIAVPRYYIPQRITNKQHIDIRLFKNSGKGVIVTGNHGNWEFLFFGCFKIINGKSLFLAGIRETAHIILLMSESIKRKDHISRKSTFFIKFLTKKRYFFIKFYIFRKN